MEQLDEMTRVTERNREGPCLLTFVSTPNKVIQLRSNSLQIVHVTYSSHEMLRNLLQIKLIHSVLEFCVFFFYGHHLKLLFEKISETT